MKYLISGWNGHTNLGDDLLLLSLITSINRKDKNSYFYILSDSILVTKNIIASDLSDKVTVIQRKGGRLSWRLQLYLLGLKCDWYILPGGSTFRDFNFETNTIKTHYKMSKIAHLAGCKIQFTGIGIGPIWKKDSIKWLKKIFKFSNATVRDKNSLNILKKYGIKNVSLSSDLLFSIKPIAVKKNRITRDPKIIGLALRNWDDSINKEENLPKKRKKLDALEKMIFLIKKIQIVFPYSEIRFYCFQKSQVFLEDDIGFAKSINKNMKTSFKIIPLILDDQCNYCSIQHKLIEADYMIGTRLHSIIISSILSIPVLAIEYDLKIRGLMASLNKLNCVIRWNNLYRKDLDIIIRNAFNQKTNVKNLQKISDVNFDFLK